MKVAIQRRTDHQHSQRGRDEREDRRGDSPTRISAETFDRWRRKFSGMQVNEAKKLRALEEENRRLKRVVADQALNLQVLKDVLRNEW